jgi:hypothetical protein
MIMMVLPFPPRFRQVFSSEETVAISRRLATLSLFRFSNPAEYQHRRRLDSLPVYPSGAAMKPCNMSHQVTTSKPSRNTTAANPIALPRPTWTFLKRLELFAPIRLLFVNSTAMGRIRARPSRYTIARQEDEGRSSLMTTRLIRTVLCATTRSIVSIGLLELLIHFRHTVRRLLDMMLDRSRARTDISLRSD